MYDMAGGGKIMLELFIMNFLAAGVIYMQYCGLFQYAQSSRFQVAFISNKHPQLVTKLFAIYQLAVVENI